MKLKRIICCALAIATLALSGCAGKEPVEFDVTKVKLTSSQLSEVEQNITKALSKKEFQGAAAVTLNVNTVYEKYFGTATPNGKKKINKNTEFQIASLTKAFTGVAIIQLADEGKLELTNKLSTYFKSEGDYNYIKDISVNDLLSKKISLGSYQKELINTNDELLHYRKLALKNDEKSEYKIKHEILVHILSAGTKRVTDGFDSNYYVLGRIVEKVTGMRFRDYVQKNIFDKLSMKHSGFASVDKMMYGYNLDDKKWRDSEEDQLANCYSYLYSSFGITSTAADLSKFYSALMNNKLTKTNLLNKIKNSVNKYYCGFEVDGKNFRAQGGTYLNSSYVFINPDNLECAILLSNQTGKTDISNTGKDIYQIINAKLNGMILEAQNNSLL